MSKILIIDDDHTVCSSLKLLLARKGGYSVQSISSPVLAQETIGAFLPDLILLDMNFTIDTSGKQGLRLLKQIMADYQNLPVILMTGWATVQLAVEGMKLGAKDFIAKPWDNKGLLDSIHSVLSLQQTTKNTNSTIPDQTQIIGRSEKMVDILQMAHRVAKTEASVLITGESGTGKELIAEAIHHNSKRSEGPFVKVNLGGISTDLFESEMFGHIKGAYTGAYSDREGRFSRAHTGTIFLDELGELDLSCQVKLLRVLQERTYERLGSSDTHKTDVRVISATNRDLQYMTIQERFREDLFYRVNLINIHLPPLRDRREDIPLLVDFFLSNLSSLYGADKPLISDATVRWLCEQEYKGNIRQLKNIVERTSLMHLGAKELSRKDFLPSFDTSSQMKARLNTLNLQELEIDAINKALSKHNHSISKASRALGITRSSLYRRIEKYHIRHDLRFED